MLSPAIKRRLSSRSQESELGGERSTGQGCETCCHLARRARTLPLLVLTPPCVGTCHSTLVEKGNSPTYWQPKYIFRGAFRAAEKGPSVSLC